MKTNRILNLVAAAVLLMTSCSNDDERMLTIINEDGSCSREMSFHPVQEDVMAPLNNSACLPYDTAAVGQSAECFF